MTQHYRLMQSDPSAIILAKNPQTGSLEETKIYKKRGEKGEDVIYLSDKQNFAFKFFNPLKEQIGAKITLNGQTDDNLLVIKPGQSITLERFLNESKKMIFETYKVDKSNPTAMEAIVNNGDIKVEFFKEEPSKPNYDTWTNTNITFGGMNSCSCGTYATLGNVQGMGSCSSNLKSKSMNMIPLEENEVETGRVEKGEKSNQNLEQVEIEFKTTPFLTQFLKLMPVSQARTYTETDIKSYCPSCRYRVRNQSWVYCPKCATKLD